MYLAHRVLTEDANKQGLWHLMQQLVDLELLGETVKRLESAWDWKAGLRQTPGRGNI